MFFKNVKNLPGNPDISTNESHCESSSLVRWTMNTVVGASANWNCGAHGKKEISGKTSAESSIFQVLRLNIFSVVLAMTLIWNRNKKYRSRCWSQDCANVVYMLLTRRAPGEAFRGYRRKLQTCLKLSRSYSWNYEPGLVIFYFVTNQLFGCEFK